MAIRRVSDLPQLKYTSSLLNSNNYNRLINSQIEISHCTNDDYSTFKSERISFGDLSAIVIKNVYDGNHTFTNGTNSFIGNVIIEGDLTANNITYKNITQTTEASFEEIDTNDVSCKNLYVTNNTNLSGNITGSSLTGIKLSSYIAGVDLNSAVTQAGVTVSSNSTIEVYAGRANILSTSTNNYLRAVANNQLQAQVGTNIYLSGESSTFNVIQGTINGGTGNSTIMSVSGNRTNGKFKFYKDIDGVALSAKWADLAEIYESDENYESGTLIKFGGDKEITIADDEVNGVITTKPGFTLNSTSLDSNDSIKLGIAMIGRTPVKVKGKLKKFDKIELSDISGIAQQRTTKKIIGIALENKDYDEIGLVECVVKLQF